MRASSGWTAAASVLVAVVVNACSPTRRAPVPAVAMASTSGACTTEVEDANVRNWLQVSDAGANFCLPPTWKYDDRFERLQSYRANPAFRARSWVSPDSTERIILEVPADGAGRNTLLDAVLNCTRNEATAQAAYRGTVGPTTQVIGDQTACVRYRAAYGDPDVTATFGDPLVRFKAIGRLDARAVLLTVRPASSGHGH